MRRVVLTPQVDPVDPTRVAFGSLAAAMLLAGCLVIGRNYVARRNRASLFMAIGWACFMLEALFYTIKYTYVKDSQPHQVFNLLENLSLVPGFISMIVLLDLISRDTIDPRKLAPALLVLGLTSALFLMLFTTDLVIVPIIVVANIGLIVGGSWLYFFIMIARNVPPALRKPALLNVVGAFLVSVMYVVASRHVSGLSRFIPSIDRIFQATGALIQAITLARHDQLLYVLPFKVYRLVTFDSRNGTALFTHAWLKKTKMIDEDLFSAVLQGMSGIITESVDKGQVQEIKMEYGVLIIERDARHAVVSVLVSSKSSRVLRDGLTRFNQQFVARYGGRIGAQIDVDDLAGAGDLVEACFSFIPRYE